jgi:prepilin-type N-terminal cleavage/methylation domain-containing protein
MRFEFTPPPDALKLNLHKGFTFSEILIALVIIGVVTILTVPHFLNNIQDKEFLTSSKRINYLISQAVGSLDISSGITAATSPEDFVNNYLSKVMKFTKICGYSNHSDCGFSGEIKDIAKNKMDLPTSTTNLANGVTSFGEITWGKANTNGYSFVSLNGYSMMLFYNQYCLEDITNEKHYIQDRICINILWDINGSKKPNQVGKDIGFTTVLYPLNSKTQTPIVAPKDANNGSFDQVDEKCKMYGNDYRAPNKDELSSMYFNSKLIKMTSSGYWSNSSAGSGLGWDQHFNTGSREKHEISYSTNIRCIKK